MKYFEVKEKEDGTKGLFAVININRTDIIHQLYGELLEERTRESVEVEQIRGGKRVTLHIVDKLFQYCNHSETPNIVIYKLGGVIAATKDIKIGEEVLFDYMKHEGGIASPFIDSKTGKRVEK